MSDETNKLEHPLLEYCDEINKPKYPYVEYCAAGDMIEYFARSSSYYAKWINPHLMLYLDDEDNSVVGVNITCVTRMMAKDKQEYAQALREWKEYRTGQRTFDFDE